MPSAEVARGTIHNLFPKDSCVTTFTSYNQSPFGLPTGGSWKPLCFRFCRKLLMRTCVWSVLSGLPTQPAEALKPESPLRGRGPRREGLDRVISILYSELLERRGNCHVVDTLLR